MIDYAEVGKIVAIHPTALYLLNQNVDVFYDTGTNNVYLNVALGLILPEALYTITAIFNLHNESTAFKRPVMVIFMYRIAVRWSLFTALPVMRQLGKYAPAATNAIARETQMEYVTHVGCN